MFRHLFGLKLNRFALNNYNVQWYEKKKIQIVKDKLKIKYGIFIKHCEEYETK